MIFFEPEPKLCEKDNGDITQILFRSLLYLIFLLFSTVFNFYSIEIVYKTYIRVTKTSYILKTWNDTFSTVCNLECIEYIFYSDIFEQNVQPHIYKYIYIYIVKYLAGKSVLLTPPKHPKSGLRTPKSTQILEYSD